LPYKKDPHPLLEGHFKKTPGYPHRQMGPSEKGKKEKLVSPGIGHGAPEKAEKGGEHCVDTRSHAHEPRPSGIPDHSSEEAEPDEPRVIILFRRHEKEHCPQKKFRREKIPLSKDLDNILKIPQKKAPFHWREPP
jgi:hypothetical protein